jgi:hypothetical protein
MTRSRRPVGAGSSSLLVGLIATSPPGRQARRKIARAGMSEFLIVDASNPSASSRSAKSWKSMLRSSLSRCAPNAGRRMRPDRHTGNEPSTRSGGGGPVAPLLATGHWPPRVGKWQGDECGQIAPPGESTSSISTTGTSSGRSPARRATLTATPKEPSPAVEARRCTGFVFKRTATGEPAARLTYPLAWGRGPVAAHRSVFDLLIRRVRGSVARTPSSALASEYEALPSSRPSRRLRLGPSTLVSGERGSGFLERCRHTPTAENAANPHLLFAPEALDEPGHALISHR